MYKCTSNCTCENCDPSELQHKHNNQSYHNKIQICNTTIIYYIKQLAFFFFFQIYLSLTKFLSQYFLLFYIKKAFKIKMDEIIFLIDFVTRTLDGITIYYQL